MVSPSCINEYDEGIYSQGLDGDDQLWMCTSNTSPLIACLYQDKLMFLLIIMLIYDKLYICIANLHLAATADTPRLATWLGGSTVHTLYELKANHYYFINCQILECGANGK